MAWRSGNYKWWSSPSCMTGKPWASLTGFLRRAPRRAIITGGARFCLICACSSTWGSRCSLACCRILTTWAIMMNCQLSFGQSRCPEIQPRSQQQRPRVAAVSGGDSSSDPGGDYRGVHIYLGNPTPVGDSIVNPTEHSRCSLLSCRHLVCSMRLMTCQLSFGKSRWPQPTPKPWPQHPRPRVSALIPVLTLWPANMSAMNLAKLPLENHDAKQPIINHPTMLSYSTDLPRITSHDNAAKTGKSDASPNLNRCAMTAIDAWRWCQRVYCLVADCVHGVRRHGW